MNLIIPRKIESQIQKALQQVKKKNNVLLIEGARQVGKTTAIENVLQKQNSLTLNLEKDRRYRAAIDSCENFHEFKELLKDEFNFEGGKDQILFIDEAQESERLGSFVRSMKEDWPFQRVILSGSTLTRLFRGETRFPVGRVKTMLVQPFSFSEFLIAYQKEHWNEFVTTKKISEISSQRHNRLLEYYDQYLQIGGLPEVVLGSLQEKQYKDILLEHLENYRQDFIRVYSEEESRLFLKAMRGVADHVGSSSLYTHALPVQDAQYSSLPGVFSRLEQWKMIHLCSTRGSQPEGSYKLHPKRYLFDSGILSYLRLSARPSLSLLKTKDASARKALGGMFENNVAAHLVSENFPLQNFRDHGGTSEIDFIINDSQTIPLEVKASLKIKGTHLKGLKQYAEKYSVSPVFTVSAAPFEIRKTSWATVINIPIYAIEALKEAVSIQT